MSGLTLLEDRFRYSSSKKTLRIWAIFWFMLRVLISNWRTLHLTHQRNITKAWFCMKN